MTTPDFILHGCGSVALTNICPRKHRQASLLWLFPLEKMPPEPHYATISHTQTHKVKTLPADAVAVGNICLNASNHPGNVLWSYLLFEM